MRQFRRVVSARNYSLWQGYLHLDTLERNQLQAFLVERSTSFPLKSAESRLQKTPSISSLNLRLNNEELVSQGGNGGISQKTGVSTLASWGRGKVRGEERWKGVIDRL